MRFLLSGARNIHITPSPEGDEVHASFILRFSEVELDDDGERTSTGDTTATEFYARPSQLRKVAEKFNQVADECEAVARDWAARQPLKAAEGEPSTEEAYPAPHDLTDVEFLDWLKSKREANEQAELDAMHAANPAFTPFPDEMDADDDEDSARLDRRLGEFDGDDDPSDDEVDAAYSKGFQDGLAHTP